MNKAHKFFFATTSLALAGCASISPPDLVKPSEVTLEQALASVGAGLYQMKEQQKDMKTGLIAESVEVTFNLAASAEDSGRLTIDLTKSVAAEELTRGREIGAEQTSSSNSSRSNAITIKFKNILTIPKDTLVHAKSPDDLANIILLPAAGGWTTFGTDIMLQQMLNNSSFMSIPQGSVKE
tara:strand:+ start:1358 stop:1900 length:543 start_codon:yes stop_codon:yes gene_type:complete